jgi:Glyoxalase-like domain
MRLPSAAATTCGVSDAAQLSGEDAGQLPRKSMDRTGAGQQSRRMTLRIQCLCIDTTDPARLATFWQSALGWRRTFEQEDQVVLEPPAGSPEDGIVPDLLFLRIPEERRPRIASILIYGPRIRRRRSLGLRASEAGESTSGRVPVLPGSSWRTPMATSSACCDRSRPRNLAGG